MKLDVILRTHDRGNVHVDWRDRYFKGTKQELVLGCTRSLVRSIQNCKNHTINLTVLDDHSSDETVHQLKEIIGSVNGNFVSLTEKGYNNSAYQQYLVCRDSEADLVYSIEDDYLHVPTAIQEMLDTYAICEEKLEGRIAVLYPFDAPEEYMPPKGQAFIVHGSARHWRTGLFTTNVVMTKPELFKRHWDKFETLALKYNGDYLKPRAEHYEESNTIWPIWQSGEVMRFNPIPSLAIHVQFESQKDPFIDWEQWWRDYAV